MGWKNQQIKSNGETICKVLNFAGFQQDEQDRINTDNDPASDMMKVTLSLPLPNVVLKLTNSTSKTITITYL